MGTQFNITYVAGSTTPDKAIIEQAVTAELATINQLMSTYIPDSEVSRFSTAEANKSFWMSSQTLDVIELSSSISALTEGAFDITVSSLVALWGFGPNYQEDKVPAASAIAAELANVGYQHLIIDRGAATLTKTRPLQVDLSAVAKGYAVDQLAQYLEAQGVTAYLVEVGGEMRIAGRKPDGSSWRVGIETPVSGERSVQRVLALENTAIATSGDYRNYFEVDGVRYSHTIDPVTGYPITHNLASVTVLDARCARADALATAFMVMGPERGLAFAEFHNIPALFIIKGTNGFIERPSSSMKPLLASASH